MNIYTDKDAFNYVVEQLLKQGERCCDESETCRYRGWNKDTIKKVSKEVDLEDTEDFDAFYDMLSTIPYNAKCAVGHLISDQIYDPAFEDKVIDDWIFYFVKQSNPSWETSENTFSMLLKLQKIHDQEIPSNWKNHFEKMSVNFDDNNNYILQEDNK